MNPKDAIDYIEYAAARIEELETLCDDMTCEIASLEDIQDELDDVLSSIRTLCDMCKVVNIDELIEALKNKE
jgi:hypothetical protein